MLGMGFRSYLDVGVKESRRPGGCEGRRRSYRCCDFSLDSRSLSFSFGLPCKLNSFTTANTSISTPDVDVPVGSIVIQGDLVGITKRDLKADVLGSIAVEGVFDFPKPWPARTSYSAGQKVYATNDGIITLIEEHRTPRARSSPMSPRPMSRPRASQSVINQVMKPREQRHHRSRWGRLRS